MIPKLRLILTSLLFISWIGYLAYLVSITRHPVILSRPQFLVADIYVLAELGGTKQSPDGKIRVTEVLWPTDDAHKQLVGTEITVRNLEKCTEPNGWIGMGPYIVPLSNVRIPSDGNEKYELTRIPISPGFHQDEKTLNYLRIYPATPQARDQLTTVIAEFH